MKSTRFSSRRRSSWSGKAKFNGPRLANGLDPKLFVKEATFTPIEAYTPQHAFTDFALHPQLQKNIVSRGYTQPTKIQDEAIPALLDNKDVIGLANTGTGKTAAFLLPLINKVLSDRSQKVLIVAPTRELAVQIEQECRLFAQNLGVYTALCIGGVNIRPQIEKLSRRPQFVIGTPGRLCDLEGQGKLYFSDYANVVLDEVDQMLDMGFIHDVKYIAGRLPLQRQSLFFSATLPASMVGITRQFLKDPVTISVKSAETAGNIAQDVIDTRGKIKIEVLHDLLVQKDFSKVLVFLRTKRGAEKLWKQLKERGFQVDALHGNKSQSQRQRAIDSFKRDRIQVLLATDVASRGLDIDCVTHVINYDLPDTYEDYIHRIGRTGRANQTGKALTFI